ncbi:MAG TPA: hypothetical protein ENK75_04985, partial [Saprospiraceae bacterium]|nr:hypothetical protein [Saprospiraceae bacterium]
MKKLIFFLFISLSFITCKDKSSQNNDNLFKFKEYIYQKTAGVISVKESVQITFAKDFDKFKEAKELGDGIFTISPKIKGKAYLRDARHIEFIPENSLEPDTEYTVKVA